MSQIFNIEYYSSPTTRHETTRMLFYHNQLFRVISTIGLPTKSSHGYKSEKILWKIRIVDSNKRLHGKESNVFRRQKDRPQVLLINYTSSSEHMLRFSALKPTVGLGCRGGARTSTIVHWWTRAARLSQETDRRWPCSGGFGHRSRGEELNRANRARLNLPKARRSTRKGQEARESRSRQVTTDG